MVAPAAQRLGRPHWSENEDERGDCTEVTLMYLEASDFTPPVPTFFSLMVNGPQLAEPAMKSLADEVYNSPSGGLIRPVGILTGGKLRSRPMSADLLFEFICIQPDRAANRHRRLSMMPTGLRGPSAEAGVKLYTVCVDKRGAAYPSVPQTYHRKQFRGQYLWTSAGMQAAEKSIGTWDDVAALDVAATCLAAEAVYWTVQIAAENGRSRLAYFTDESGVKGFFDLRSAPMAGGRRAALRHFVNAHLRRPKPVRVREHFRGREEFEWFGLKCRVVPPAKLADRGTR